ncbi:MAG: NifU family protein [Alphaproteobacteria bacterium]|nr:NifU family protein [Alphaproteobacteria bacterium]
MFIQTEATPNPDALKFLPGLEVATDPIHFGSKEESFGCILVNILFDTKGVEAVFFGQDFITITKSPEIKWEILKPFILSSIIDHFSSGLAANAGMQAKKPSIELSDLSEIEKQIIDIIETRVRPSVAMDGGDITYCGFKEGIVYLELKGSCSGCPSASITLKSGIESMLQYYIPEVKAVEEVSA